MNSQAVIPAVDDAARLAHGLARCEQALARHLAAAVAVYGQAALDVIDLPDTELGSIDAEAVRVTAVLLWAAEMEAAGLLVFVEALATALATGTLVLDLSDATLARLIDYQRQHHERFTAAERAELYQRTFGDSTGFPVDFARLVDLLAEFARQSPQQRQRVSAAQVQAAAQAVASGLSMRGSGIAAYAARDILANLRTASAILQIPELDRALGGQGPVRAIELHAPELLHTPLAPRVHLDRARAGFAILAWLADQAAILTSGRLELSGDAPVAQAAALWQAMAEG